MDLTGKVDRGPSKTTCIEFRGKVGCTRGIYYSKSWNMGPTDYKNIILWSAITFLRCGFNK